MQRQPAPVDMVMSVSDAETKLGEDLRALRLSKNMSQLQVAQRAGVGEKAVRRLEAGQGSTVTSLVAVLGVLGRDSWLQTMAPVASINPLTMPTRGIERQRASGSYRARSADTGQFRSTPRRKA